MSVKAIAEVWEKSEATGTALVLMLAIADHMNESTGTAWPSLDRLARYARVSRRRVMANINRLIESGELVRMSGGMGPGNTNEYRIALPSNPIAENEFDKGDANGNKGDVYGNKGDADGKKGCRKRHPIPYRTVKEPLLNIDRFDDFWSQYPKKVAKGAAKTAYGRALKKVSHDEIMAGLARYNPDPKYTCNPSTWLSQERWTDEHTHIAEQSADAERIGRTATAFEKAATYFRQRDASPDMGDRRDDQRSRGAITALVDGSGMDRSDDDTR